MIQVTVYFEQCRSYPTSCIVIALLTLLCWCAISWFHFDHKWIFGWSMKHKMQPNTNANCSNLLKIILFLVHFKFSHVSTSLASTMNLLALKFVCTHENLIGIIWIFDKWFIQSNLKLIKSEVAVPINAICVIALIYPQKLLSLRLNLRPIKCWSIIIYQNEETQINVWFVHFICILVSCLKLKISTRRRLYNQIIRTHWSLHQWF